MIDGGGIKGYGSLLILRALMNKIGAEERRLDRNTESSFYPCMYKPSSKNFGPQPRRNGDSSADTPVARESTAPVATPTTGLPDSSLFLPCHYFQCAGGTSTGGCVPDASLSSNANSLLRLISIMVSRFRMTVDDCLQEYKTFGSEVFGRRRILSMKGVLWNKFNEEHLYKVIEDVTSRHCENPSVTTRFPSPKDICRTLVHPSF
jgi:hypothetical protein